jgi:hypothetical protein
MRFTREIRAVLEETQIIAPPKWFWLLYFSLKTVSPKNVWQGSSREARAGAGAREFYQTGPTYHLLVLSIRLYIDICIFRIFTLYCF